MDMPDLNKFHIKRSIKFPVHYIYIFHSIFSIHSYLRHGAIDHYDTIFCVGEHHELEIRETEKFYKLKEKKLIKYGFGRLDSLINEKDNYPEILSDTKNLILIVPSYGNKNLLEVCGIELIDILLKSNFKILLRPHFRIFDDSPELMNSIKENFGLPNLKKFSRKGWLNGGSEAQSFEGYINKLQIKVSGQRQLASQLSGGNQQKVVLAKWLERNAEILIFDEPTRGIDVGAKFEIYQWMNQLAKAGKGIIMISSELPEVLGMSDRIIVMKEGGIMGELTNSSEVTQKTLMSLAIGEKVEKAA
mgnify:CR=1 FL=1